MHFIIQSNINLDDFDDLTKAIQREGHTYESFYHKPFDTAYPAFDKLEPTFFYAASSVTDKIFEDNPHQFIGVFSHTKGINMHLYYEGESSGMMWSPRAYGRMTINEAIHLIEPNENKVFSRPAIDDKLFAGQVSTQSSLVDQLKCMVGADPSYGDHELFIGGVRYPSHEYRIFMSPTGPITSSLYRVNGKVVTKEGAPENVLKLARKFYSQNYEYMPALCVIDIATDEFDDNPGVIELNSIHNSGFYAINKRALVKGIYNYMKDVLYVDFT